MDRVIEAGIDLALDDSSTVERIVDVCMLSRVQWLGF
tara:strand:+ start:2453 stop:2563 length:111 start_codon:yes stop_codon:yes gene_type:complete